MHRTYLDCKESQLAKDTTSHYPACHGYAGRLILCSCLQARPPVSKKKGYDMMVLFGVCLSLYSLLLNVCCRVAGGVGGGKGCMARCLHSFDLL